MKGLVCILLALATTMAGCSHEKDEDGSDYAHAPAALPDGPTVDQEPERGPSLGSSSPRIDG